MNILVIGASSGMGKALVFEYQRNRHKVCALARRVGLMERAFSGLSDCVCGYLDINAVDAAERLLRFVSELGGVDVCIITAGIGYVNRELAWEQEGVTLETNVLAFSRMAVTMFNYFKTKEPAGDRRSARGHLAGISSLAGIKGLDACPAYSASKGFEALYLQALRRKSNKERMGIKVTTIVPGFVDTDMISGNKDVFWMVPAKKAARQICRGMERRRAIIFVSKRWGLLARIFRLIPGWIYERI